jgi:hypothetical protein
VPKTRKGKVKGEYQGVVFGCSCKKLLTSYQYLFRDNIDNGVPGRVFDMDGMEHRVTDTQ